MASCQKSAVGEWSENKMHGQGTYVYASGDIYTGSFVEGNKQGSGSYYFKVSATLQYLALDAWRHHVKQYHICHAFQIAFTVCWLQSTESQFIGEWDKGTFVSGTWALSDGSQFKGDFGSQVWCSRPVSASASVVFNNCSCSISKRVNSDMGCHFLSQCWQKRCSG